MEEELDEIAEGDIGADARCCASSGARSREDLERAEEKFERYVEELDEECPAASRRAGRRRDGSRSGSAGTAGSSAARGSAPRTAAASTSATSTAASAPSPSCSTRPARSAARQLAAQVWVGSGRSSGAAATPTAATSRRTRPKSLEITCPQCQQGEIVEKRTRFGLVLRLRPLPRVRLRGEQPAGEGPPVPRVRLARCVERPKSYRCWNCGAEMDKELTVTKHGDVEAEAAARAAKAAARAERAREGREGREEARTRQEVHREAEAGGEAQVDRQARDRAKRSTATTPRAAAAGARTATPPDGGGLARPCRASPTRSPRSAAPGRRP